MIFNQNAPMEQKVGDMISNADLDQVVEFMKKYDLSEVGFFPKDENRAGAEALLDSYQYYGQPLEELFATVRSGPGVMTKDRAQRVFGKKFS